MNNTDAPRPSTRAIFRRIAATSSCLFALHESSCRNFLRVVTLIAICSLVTPDAKAQTDLSSISGTVQDSSGAILSGAAVSVQNDDTSASRSLTTSSDGNFNAPALLPGNYTVTVTAPGFSATVLHLNVVAGQVSAKEIRLNAAAVASETRVYADGSTEIQLQSHEVRFNLDTEQLVELPSPDRNPLSLATLGPISEPASDAGQNTSSGQAFGTTANQLNVGGGMDSQTGFLQDGVENVTLFTQSANLVPSVEAIRNVHVISNGADARYRQPSIVNVSTKGGTNALHGSAFEFLQNDLLNAKNYSLTTSQDKTPLRYNLFGGAIGGPIVRNKVFFLGSYLGLRNRNTSYATTRVPTLQERVGDFSASPVTLYDPLTYSAGGNRSFRATTGRNAIPTARISNFAKTLLPYIPEPNLPLNTGLNINYQTPLTRVIENNQYLGRIDWTIGDHDTLYLSGVYGLNPTVNPSFSSLYGGRNDVSAANGFVEETHVFGPRLVNSIRFGYNRSVLLKTVNGAGERPYHEEFGLTGLSPEPEQYAPPTVQISSLFTLGDRYAPQGATQNRFQVADQIDKSAGRHQLFMGGEFIRSYIDGNWTILNNGYYQFDGSMTAQFTGGSRRANGAGLADFLLGYPYRAAGATGTSVGAFREWQLAGYFQDDWKLASNLTLNLGVRYDFSKPPNDANGASSVYDVATNRTIPGTWRPNYRNFSPRVGFAYSPARNTVIHGGYGIYYAGSPYNFLQFLLAHPPNFIQQQPAFNQRTPTPVENTIVANPPATGQTPQTLGLHMPDVSVQKFNLLAEHNFLQRYNVTVGYAGEVGRNESTRVNANQPFAKSPGSTIFDIRPYGYAGDVFAQYNIGRHNTHAMLATFDARLPHGSRFLVSYTLSKSMNISDGDRNTVQNYYDLNQYYALAAWDRTHSFKLSGIYKLPFGPGQAWLQSGNAFSRLVLGGWQIAGNYRYATGLPVSVTATNTTSTSGIGTFMAQRVCDPTQGFVRTQEQWFNTSCFVQPNAGEYGIGGRNSVRQPPLNQLDINAGKTFFLTERYHLQFRLEAFNALNHPQFALPGSLSVTNTDLGAISGTARSMRTVQAMLRFSF